MLRTLDGAPVYVTSPDLVAPHGSDLSLFGVPTLRWWKRDTFFPPVDTAHVDSLSVSTQAGLLWGFAAADISVSERRLRLLRPPSDASGLTRPLVVTRPRGKTGVVFFRPAEGGDGSTAGGGLRFYERRDTAWIGGAGLEIPGQLHWSRESSVALYDGASTVVLATAFESGRGGSIVLATHQNGSWSLRSLSTAGLPYYLTAAIVSPDTALVVFGATDGQARVANGSHLFQMRLSLRTGVATTPQRIQWSGRSAVVRPVLLQGQIPGTLFLTWGVAQRGATDADSLFVSRSDDRGASWNRAVATAMARPLTRLTSVLFRDGRVAILGVDGARTPPRDRTARLYAERGARLTSLVLPFVSPGVDDLTAIVARGDRLTIVWSATTAASPGGREQAPYTNVVTTTLRCLLGSD